MILTLHDFIEPVPPQPFKFLHDGKLYPVRTERRGDNLYWYMSKMVNGRTYRIYLGGLSQLDAELVENAVKQIEYQANGVTL